MNKDREKLNREYEEYATKKREEDRKSIEEEER